MASSQSHLWRDLAIATAVFGVAIAFIARDYVAAEWNARAAQREVIAFANSIPLGATREAVSTLLARGGYKHLNRRPHSIADHWFFHTPPRLGANDWILIVEFERDRVTAVRVATSDHLGRRPDGAPEERRAIPPDRR